MKDYKKYRDIKVMEDSLANGFETGDHIVIQEKIDGANLSVEYVTDEDKVRSIGSGGELSESNNLRGGYEFVQSLDKDLISRVLGDKLILFGEWLVQHTIRYPEDKYNKMYCYDVYDKEKKEYLQQSEVRDIVNQLGLIYVPVFYDGPFISWEHAKQFVGKTDLGGDTGEGIVIKNISKISSNSSSKPSYLKIVIDDLAEIKKRNSAEKAEQLSAEIDMYKDSVKSIVTDARIHKLLLKLVDAGIIPENYGKKDYAVIAKNIFRDIYDDCLKEEPEIVESSGKMFGKIANSIISNYLKNNLK